MLDVSPSHVSQLIERGVLHTVRIAGSSAVRIPVEDVYRAAGIEPPAVAAATKGEAG